MPYVHLANGDVEKVTEKELAAHREKAAPNTFHRDGKQHAIIGVYPEEVELPKEDSE